MTRKYHSDEPAWLYVTTNLITGKKYIGQTTSTRKDYFGSGKIITDAIRKYGKKNFSREIIYSGTWEEVDLLEALYIEKYNAVNSDEYYNLKEGGHEGRHNPNSSKKMSIARLGKTYEEIYGEQEAERQRHLRRECNTGENNPFYGKKHSDETIKVIKQKRAIQEITEESNKKRSEAIKQLPKYECFKCGELYFKRNLVQHHNEKCRKVIT